MPEYRTVMCEIKMFRYQLLDFFDILLLAYMREPDMAKERVRSHT